MVSPFVLCLHKQTGVVSTVVEAEEKTQKIAHNVAQQIIEIEQYPFQDPKSIYVRRREERHRQAERLAQTERGFGTARLLVFVIFLIMAWFAFHEQLFHGAWLLAPVVLYLLLAARHDSVIGARKRAGRAVQFYDMGIRRLDNKWQGGGNSGARFLRADHPYAIDLDIFGRASLYELICNARTQAGENYLAQWLQSPSPPTTVRDRQEAVRELKIRLDLREDLAVLGDQVKGTVKPDILVEWGEQPPIRFDSYVYPLLAVLATGTMLAALWWGTGHGAQYFVASFVLEQLCWLSLRGRLLNITGSVDKPLKDLSLFAVLLARVEQEPVQSPRLQHLSRLLKEGSGTKANSPAARIARLERLVELLQIPTNPFLRLVDVICQFSTFVTFAIERWRQSNGPQIRQWIEVVGEFEAIASLAGYAYEHPDDVFPEILESTPGSNTETYLDASGLAHPLLPATSAIRNNLRFTAQRRLYIVSGSNMSGKSTLMRALGTNVVLALAGAPVRAYRMRLVPLRIGASIRTQDSLEAGISRFYAEILRLRQIVDLTSSATIHSEQTSQQISHQASQQNSLLLETAPLLFLLDEILHGTNSHDRRVGADAVIRALLANNAMGLVSTHDLALAQIAEDPHLPATNVHLQDQLTDGKMTFDYRLHPGIVTRSNAIELMRAVGLDV